MIQMADRLTLDAPKRTTEGYMAVRAKAARTGIYDYRASEVGAPADKFSPTDTVKIYRDAADVFSPESVRSFISKPITDDHPHEAVTTRNWRDHSRGIVMGAMRDGDYLAFDLVLMDQATIDAVDNGKRELSNGYQSKLEWTPGQDANGNHYDAKMTSIRGNHVAVVRAGRAGPHCCIVDGDHFAICDSIPATDYKPNQQEARMKLTNLDGLSVNLTDGTAVEQALSRLDAKVTEGATALATATTAHDQAMAAKDAEIEKLKGLVVDQAKIDQLADAKAAVVEQAKAIVGDSLPATAGKSVVEVRRMALDAKGIDTKDKSDDYVAARFDALVEDAKTDTNDNRQPVVPSSITNPMKLVDNSRVVSAMRDARYA